MKQKSMIYISAMIMVSFILIGCNKGSVQSIWNDQQLKIDGFYADWGTNLLYNEKSNLGFAVANDSNCIYLCLVSADQQVIRQVMMRGLELKIDVPKMKGHTFKIKYPVGMEGMDMSMMRSMRSGGKMGGFDQDWMGETGGPDMTPPMEEMQTEFHLYGPGRDDKRIIPMQNNMGIDINVGRSQRQLVYEIKIPIQLIKDYFEIDQSIAIAEMVLNFKMPEMKMADMPSRGGMGGPSGGGMGGHPGRPDGMNSNSDNFKFSVRASLAAS